MALWAPDMWAGAVWFAVDFVVFWGSIPLTAFAVSMMDKLSDDNKPNNVRIDKRQPTP